MVAAGLPDADVDRLGSFVAVGDELAVAEIRSYALADRWGRGRRETLEPRLQATRHGLLELRCELLCLLCRGATATETSPDATSRTVHCDTSRLHRRSVALRRGHLPTDGRDPAGPAKRVLRRAAAGDAALPRAAAAPRWRHAHASAVPRARPLPPAVSPGLDETARATVEAGGPREPLAGIGSAPDHACGGRRPQHRERDGRGPARPPRAHRVERHRCDGGRSHALQAYRDLFAAQGLRLGEPISAGTPILAITDLLDTLLGLRGAREPVGAAPVELPWRARTGTYFLQGRRAGGSDGRSSGNRGPSIVSVEARSPGPRGSSTWMRVAGSALKACT